MDTLHLYSTPLCPFAHRVRLVISEKRLPARIVAIDLADKPASFLQLAPDGKVPLLVHGAGAVSDSAVINEYLEEAFPVVAMLPRDALLRARARMWIRFADARLYEHTSQLLHSLDPAVHARSLAAIDEDLSWIEDHAFASGDTGPYWTGGQFTLVDAAFYPWFEQVGVLESFFGLRWSKRCRSLARWRDAVAARPSVAAIAESADFYLEAYGALRAARHARSA